MGTIAKNNNNKPIIQSSTSQNDDVTLDVLARRRGRASPEQLDHLQKRVELYSKEFFHKPHDYTIYSKDILFIDNTRSFRIEGLTGYVIQINLFKVSAMLKYSQYNLQILNIVPNLDESSLRIRWRVNGTAGLMRLALGFWRLSRGLELNDYISTLYVDRQGKIDCHIRDNIETKTNTTSSNTQTTNGVKMPFLDGINKNTTW